MSARTGAFSYIKYGWESSFKGGSSARNKVFGKAQRVTSITRRENVELVRELGMREASGGYFRQFEGGLSVEFLLSNPWFFKGLLGSVTTSGSGPYTHTYTKTKVPVSMEVEVGLDLGNESFARLLKGCVINTVTLTATQGDAVRVRMDALFADEGETSYGSALYDTTFDVMTFDKATVEMPVGTVLAEVQSFDLTVGNNALLVYGLGDYKPMSVVWQAFDVEGRLSITMKDSTFLDLLRSGLNNGCLKFYMSPENRITINFGKMLFGEHSHSLEPNALILEDIPIAIVDITSVEAVNNVGAHP